MLELVHLNGATRIHSLKRKDQAGHVEYWKAQCGESRMLRLGGGKERKLLPIRTCACNLFWSCSGEQHLESDARVMRHASGNGISRGVKPADNVRPTQSEGKEGLTL